MDPSYSAAIGMLTGVASLVGVLLGLQYAVLLAMVIVSLTGRKVGRS